MSHMYIYIYTHNKVIRADSAGHCSSGQLCKASCIASYGFLPSEL